jgi:hypothetical protein
MALVRPAQYISVSPSLSLSLKTKWSKIFCPFSLSSKAKFGDREIYHTDEELITYYLLKKVLDTKF